MGGNNEEVASFIELSGSFAAARALLQASATGRSALKKVCTSAARASVSR